MSMSFDDTESSPNQAQPIELYLFQYGPGPTDYFAYTDAEMPVTAQIDAVPDPVIFAPIPIDRDNITSSGTLDKQTINVTVPNNVSLCDLFRYVPPSQVVQLTIFQAHYGDPEALVSWAGRVLSATSDGNAKVFACEPIQTSLKRVGLRRNWQLGCPHLLYGPRCRADQASATIQTQAQAVNGPLLTLLAGWAPDATRADFEGGTVAWTNPDGRQEKRSLIRVVDDQTVLLSSTTLTLIGAGTVLTIKKGCPHDEASCSRIHNNINNYGGQSKIPTTNPTGIKNSYE